MKLFGDRSATDNVTTFEDESLYPRLGKVTGGDESVVTRTDDYRIVCHSGSELGT
jgi:hypothetical protein